MKVKPQLNGLGHGDALKAALVVQDKLARVGLTELGQLADLVHGQAGGIGDAFGESVRGDAQQELQTVVLFETQRGLQVLIELVHVIFTECIIFKHGI